MAVVTGEVVTDTDGTFKAVFKHGDTIIGEHPVPSVDEGEEMIVEAMKEIMERMAEDAAEGETDA